MSIAETFLIRYSGDTSILMVISGKVPDEWIQHGKLKEDGYGNGDPLLSIYHPAYQGVKYQRSKLSKYAVKPGVSTALANNPKVPKE